MYSKSIYAALFYKFFKKLIICGLQILFDIEYNNTFTCIYNLHFKCFDCAVYM